MLHSLPALLDELERRLLAGEDPISLVGSIRWPNVIDWPADVQAARNLKQRLAGINMLINGLQAPLQATLMGLNQQAAYQAKGSMPLPKTISMRFQQSI
ncbi:MAG TPA: hypothetical protein PKL14_06065 [Holophaga sp.]|jgi:hypothetical protein|nr:hypothetical protein [Holophaga sp.]